MSDITRRRFLGTSLLAAAAAAGVPPTSLAAQSATASGATASKDLLRIGVIGIRGRGRGHVGEFKKSPDSEVVALCDPDSAVIAPAMKAVPTARHYTDLRKMLEDKSIDAVSIATPNHWHALATIWALEAGKHVYVEKPISFDVAEGRAVVEAAARAGKVVQHGTQSRSHAATRDAMAWIRGGGLGKVRAAYGLCYKRRESIGKVEGPQTLPATIDYDLWTGPAEMRPLQRKNLHYDWHWDYNTGNGDIGNQGVHQMDIARWGLGLDGLPTSVQSCGGRLGYDDDGNTANTQVSVYDYGDQRIVFEVRGLRTGPYMGDTGASIGVVFHCEHGYLVSSSYSKVLAYDLDGNEIKTFRGGGNHFQNFLDAIKSGNPSAVHADPLEGHLSSALCHLGNISYRLGTENKLAATTDPFGAGEEAGNESFRRFREHLVANGLDAKHTDYRVGPKLTFDVASEQFVGRHAAEANAMARRPGRGAFVIRQGA